MDTIVDAVQLCLPWFEQRRGVYLRADNDSDIDATAAAFVQELLTAEKSGVELERRLDNVVGTTGWNWVESLAKAILAVLERVIKTVAHMASAMAEALAKVTAEAVEWSKEHPVYITLIVFGILVILSPWVIEALGFAELGPLEGESHCFIGCHYRR